MWKKLEISFKKIENQISSKGFSFDEILGSKDGSIFASHLENVMEFCQKGFFLSFIPAFIPVINKIYLWLQTEEAEKLVKANIKDKKEAQMVEAFSEYQKIEPNWLEKSTADSFINEKEQMRFISYLTVTVTSYFEIYVNTRIDNIENSLIRYDKYYSRRYGLDIKNTLRELLRKDRNNGFIQIRNLYKVLGIEKDINKLLTDSGLQNLHRVISAIINLRNRIIHQKPFPDLSILDEDKIAPLKKHITSKIEYSEFEKVIEENNSMPSIFKTVMEEIYEIISDSILSIGLLRKIPELMAIYTAIFDNFIKIYFDKN